MSGFLTFLIAFFVTFIFFLLFDPIVRWLMRQFGLYAIVEEGTCHVYILFGKVVGVLQEPGLQLLWLKLGPSALVINWIGEQHVLDTRLDQQYHGPGFDRTQTGRNARKTAGSSG